MNDIENNLVEDYTIKDLLYDDFILHPTDYYHEFFALINFVDTIIEKSFQNKLNDTPFIIEFEKWNNKRFAMMVFNTVIERFKSEHMLANNQDNSSYKLECKFDFSNYVMSFNLIDRISQSQENQRLIFRDGDRWRMSGRTTRLANEAIQTLYRVGEVFPQDHFHDFSDMRGIGRRNYAQMPDRLLFDKIKRRIDREFPEHIKKMTMIDTRNFRMSFNRELLTTDKINYKKFEI